MLTLSAILIKPGSDLYMIHTMSESKVQEWKALMTQIN